MSPRPDGSDPAPHTDVMTAHDQPEATPPPVGLLVLNHHRDDMAPTIEALRRQGYAVTETQSIIETHRVLAKMRPALIVLNPLVLQPGSVEIEVLEELQRDDDPVPVVLLLEDLDAAYTAKHCKKLPFRDFITKPFSTDELLHRVDLLMLSRDNFLALQQRARELEGLVYEDFKTGLINDRHFRSIQNVEFKRAQRHHEPLSLLLVDVDDFKSVNDTTEYAFGDEVLVHVAQCLKHTIRATDYAARFGGDEFALLLPHTSPEEAVRTAERVRDAVSAMHVEAGDYKMQVTVSIGIGTFDGKTRFSAEELRTHANLALKDAKLQGKNRVKLHTD